MRTKSLLTFALMLAGVAILFLVAVDVALTQDGAVRPRPTAVSEPQAADHEPSAPAAPDALPDLVITNFQFLPTDPYVGDAVSVYVTIKNQGNADVGDTETFYLDLYINPPTDDLRGMIGDYYEGVQGSQLDAGQSTIVKIPLNETIVFTDAVSYNLWAQVDTPEWAGGLATGWILESDEDNNVWGPEYVTVRTHFSWVQKDHVDFFRNSMASTLDVVPVAGTVGIITNTPGLEINGDSALALGVFDEPPQTTWGLSSNTNDYNMIYPDTQLNAYEDTYQRYPFVHAEGDLVVVVWEDGRNAPTYGKDIYLRWSNDEGQTWYPGAGGIQVNETFDDHDINDQKHPAVAVAPNNTIVVAWQDHRGDSFDIYVQAFRYDDGTETMVRCDANGDCTTDCDASSQACNFRVDTGANDQDQILPDIDVDAENNFYIVWQDQRNGNDDIFAVRSYYTTTTPCPVFVAGSGYVPPRSVKLNLAPDQLNVCWGADARIHDDPTITKQSSPSVAAVEGVKVVDFDYIVIVQDPGPPPVIEVVVTHVYTEPAAYVTVAWEDWREGDADIYLTYSDDGGRTYVFDERLNDDKPPDTTNGLDQTAPAVAVNQWMKWVVLFFPTPYGEVPSEVELPVTTMHVVWQDARNSTGPGTNDNPDIYYQAMTVEPYTHSPWPLVFETEDEQLQINGNDERDWQDAPPWQGEPDVAATGSGLTLGDSEGYNAYIVWADGRNYGGDFDNLDIYFRLLSNVGEPSAFVGGNNIAVNSGARLHEFTLDLDDYRKDIPPHARQRYPSIASTLIAEWPLIYDGYVYVVWDDDRILDPFVDRNIYMTRSNLMFGGHRWLYGGPGPGQGERYGSGAHVSEVFCSAAYDTTWYVADWHAVTDAGTYLTLQTRLGDSRAEVLSSDWYPERFPYPDDALGPGAPLQGYDAPGQHIEDENGEYWPEARCIQYRVNFWARDAAYSPGVVELNTPFLFDVILHYERPFMVYLPVLFRNYPAP